jgi:hypothetical protein
LLIRPLAQHVANVLIEIYRLIRVKKIAGYRLFSEKFFQPAAAFGSPFTADGVERMRSFRPYFDRPGFFQHRQVVGDGSLGQAELLDQIADVQLSAFSEFFEYPLADGMSDRLKKRRETKFIHSFDPLIFIDEDDFSIIMTVIKSSLAAFSRLGGGCGFFGNLSGFGVK